MSRKQLKFPAKTIPMSIRIPLDIAHELDEDAKRYNVTRNQVVTAILEEYYADEKGEQHE